MRATMLRAFGNAVAALVAVAAGLALVAAVMPEPTRDPIAQAGPMPQAVEPGMTFTPVPSPSPRYLPNLPRPCWTEDDPGPCYWNAAYRGNGIGRSFVVQDDGRIAYVNAALLPEVTP